MTSTTILNINILSFGSHEYGPFKRTESFKTNNIMPYALGNIGERTNEKFGIVQ